MCGQRGGSAGGDGGWVVVPTDDEGRWQWSVVAVGARRARVAAEGREHASRTTHACGDVDGPCTARTRRASAVRHRRKGCHGGHDV
mmetsp:Transcript_5016/g.11063  ORF Transcript_5016/g.11063 Transcript_5016/m.11063 type:complete len:86 (-) Transcript_5016:317-574(-)